MRDREASATAAFVAIANSLVEGYDPLDLFSGPTRDCAAAAGHRRCRPVAGRRRRRTASDGRHLRTHLRTRAFQLQRAEGPCLDCYHGGAPVLVTDLEHEASRWSAFVPAAAAAGFASVHALPMRLPGIVLAALGLSDTNPGD